MSLQKLQEIGQKQGVSAGEVAQLHQHGLTLGVVEQAQTLLSVNLAGLLQLFQQFGPAFIAMITSLLSLAKTPQADPTPTPIDPVK